ncbi:hypothetical protein Pelo_19216 [Pelomyxa schiedti]|nr:hypothetical protein Pelo_19216 [Pelomyxa schiedti]
MDSTASDTTIPEGSSCASLRVKDQFAAILMCAHPRCGMQRAQDLSSDPWEEAVRRPPPAQCDSLGAIRVLWDWISHAPTRWFFLMSSAYSRGIGIAFGVSPLMGAVTSDVRFLQPPPKVSFVCANPFSSPASRLRRF